MRTRVTVFFFALMFVSDGAGENVAQTLPTPTLTQKFAEIQDRIDAVEVQQHRIERALHRRGK